MLRGVPDIIGSDLLKALADTGHGDLIVIADHFYPPVTKSPNAISIQAKGNTAAEMVDAVLQLVPLDVEYEAHPIEYMVPDADSGVVLTENKVWDDTIAAVVKPRARSVWFCWAICSITARATTCRTHTTRRA